MKREEEDFRKYYEIEKEPIGTGGFSSVYKAKEKNSDEYRAIKVFDKNIIKEQFFTENLYEMNEEDMNQYINDFKKEIKNMVIMQGKNNENINSVKFYEYFNNENEFAIVMELCDNNLIKLFENKKTKEGLSVEEIYNILIQLNNSFKIMKENKIVHRDLKLENILLKYENNGKYKVKLTDYGISKQLLNTTHLKTNVGTLKYEAPEILNGNQYYDEKCDLWSLGVVIYRLCFKKFPFDGENEVSILQLIQNGQKLLKKTKNKEINDLLEKLLVIDPKKRLGWDGYLSHSFFKK